jgi:transcriptional regulator with XRE-family HTH domain
MTKAANEVTRFKTPSGDEMVVLPAAEYLRMIEAAEMAEDVAAFDEFSRKLASGEEELIPAEIVDRILAGENCVRVWREHRGLTVKALADKAGVTPAYLSQVETGERDGALGTYRKLAGALGVSSTNSWPELGGAASRRPFGHSMRTVKEKNGGRDARPPWRLNSMSRAGSAACRGG